MSLSINLPEILEQQLAQYCQQHQLSQSEIIRLALERLLNNANSPLSPYELGKTGFGADQIHEGDIAQNSKSLLKARFIGMESCYLFDAKAKVFVAIPCNQTTHGVLAR